MATESNIAENISSAFSPRLELEQLSDLSDEQIDELMSISYTQENMKILNNYDKNMPEHILDLIDKFGYNETLDILRNSTSYNELIYITIRDKGIRKIQNETDKITYKKSGTKGLGTCKKCGCEELRFETVKRRSADEPLIEIYQCVRCGYEWKKG